MHQQGGTIENALDSIASHEYVLPAIQREFVWQPEQVCNLFDSLMQGYPFGEFMLWRVARRIRASIAGTISSTSITSATTPIARSCHRSTTRR